MKRIIAAFLFGILLLVACDCESKKPKEPEVKSKYTVWVGGDLIQVGYETDTTFVKNGILFFTDKKTGKQKQIPLSNVGSIERN